jgi:MinD superfamily P-loop ATPase
VRDWSVAVASGKGGTGKTTVAVSLALSLGKVKGAIQFLDCDVEEPDAGLFLKARTDHQREITIAVPSIDSERCTGCGKCRDVCQFNAMAVVSGKALSFDSLCHGCGGCTLICPEGAITEVPKRIGTLEQGAAGNIAFMSGRLDIGQPQATPLVRALKAAASRDIPTILDSPPGTGCPVVETVKDCDYCILVTEPTPFGLYDLELMVKVLEILGIPSGIVINRDDGASATIEEYASRKDIPVLMRIPLRREIAEPLSRGIPLVEADSGWERKFLELFVKVEDSL